MKTVRVNNVSDQSAIPLGCEKYEVRSNNAVSALD